MQTVVETPPFQSQAAAAGMSEAEIAALISMIAADPMAGDPIIGTGGCRKLRVAGRGKGKSGGYRVVTFYTGTMLPVFLIACLSKGDGANFTKAQRNNMAKVTKTIVEGYRRNIRKITG